MDKLLNFLNKAKSKLNERLILLHIVSKDRDVLDLIINLNTEDQLYKDGIRSDGSKIGTYSNLTIEFKKIKGQKYDHITLKDTGDFYDSFKPFVDSNGDIEINTDPIKIDVFGDKTNLIEKYGSNIVGLTSENIDKLNKVLIPKIRKYVLEQVF